MELEKLRLDMDGSVAVITMDDPDSLNPVSVEMAMSMIKALDHCTDKKNGVRCVVLTGAGRGFCSGANLARFDAEDDESQGDRGETLEFHIHPILRRMRDLPVPLITAVNGPAAGVGMSFGIMGDMILAGKSAFFLQAFRRVGLVPDGSSTWLLPRMIGLARSRELSLLGEKLSAEKALEWGLINRVYEDDQLMDEAMKLAKELAAGPSVSLGLIRKLYVESFENDFETQIQLERKSQQTSGYTEDHAEGVTAFMEKRQAQFKGQ